MATTRCAAAAVTTCLLGDDKLSVALIKHKNILLILRDTMGDDKERVEENVRFFPASSGK